MNPEYAKRKAKINELVPQVLPFSKGIFLAGSVAYNPDAVKEGTDIDLIVLAHFHRLDYEGLYKRLGQPLNKRTSGLASEGRINIFSISVPTDSYHADLHFWDGTALECAITPNHATTFYKTHQQLGEEPSTHERLRSLQGQEKIVKLRVPYEEGSFVTAHSLYSLPSQLYLGTQAYNLLLSPTIIEDPEGYIVSAQNLFGNTLRKLIQHTYGRDPSKEVSLVKALPLKVQAKIPDDLKEKLLAYIA